MDLPTGYTTADIEPGADLAGADLGSATLAGADLSQADLSGADLGLATLEDVELRYADLSNVDLSYATLVGVDLTGADLRETDLTGITVEETVLPRSALDEATFDALDITGSPLGERFAAQFRAHEWLEALVAAAEPDGPLELDPTTDATRSVTAEQDDGALVVEVTDEERGANEDGEKDDEERSEYVRPTCPSCGDDTADQVTDQPEFCLECGTGLVLECPQCGTESGPTANYCSNCGVELERPPDREPGAEFTPYTRNTVRGRFTNGDLQQLSLVHEFQRAPLYGRGVEYTHEGGTVTTRTLWVS